MSTPAGDIERRQFERQENSTRVEVAVANYHETLTTSNVSRGGVFLNSEPEQQLPVQTIARLTLSNEANAAKVQTILARVVWVNEKGMGLEFLNQL